MKIGDLKKWKKLYERANEYADKYFELNGNGVVCMDEVPLGKSFHWSETKEGLDFWDFLSKGLIAKAKAMQPELFEMKTEVTVNIEVPEGYEVIDFRSALKGEYFIALEGHVVMNESSGTIYKYFILKKLRFRADEFSQYFSAHCSGDIVRLTEIGSDLDKKRYDIGNYFETKEEAEIYAEKVKNIFSENLLYS